MAPIANADAPPAVTKVANQVVDGALVIAGGGPLPDAVRNRFVELAGGKGARLVVIPTAGASAEEDPEAAAAPWQKLGLASVVVLHTRDRSRADAAEFVKPLTEATGVWLEGGDQSRLATAYRGTAVERALRKLLARGGVVGGTSAGAAALSSLMIIGGNPAAATEPGLDLLPGVVVDQHFLKRNRANRLLGVLAHHPGYAGIGVDEQTAIVVKGRSITVVGNSYALLCLAASARRPAGIQVLKDGDHADLIALRRAAVARAGPAFPPEKPDAPVVPLGTLIIGGGGGMPQVVWERFIALAGGPDAPIIVVPTANEDPIRGEPSEARALKRFGARNVHILHTRSRAEADRPEFYAPLKDARGVWFTGGRQWRFVDAYAGTGTERAFHEVLARGGVIGGSSAGASIQSDYMPRGDPLGNLNIVAEGYERGFGFLKGVAIDQHFFARRRPADMTALMQEFPQLLGIGIDEGTVIVVHGSEMDVVGKSRVAVYDRSKRVLTGGKDYEEIPAGVRYDLVKRQRLP